MTLDVDLVVFDLGEVLSEPPTHLDELAQIAGSDDPRSFAQAYWTHRDGYDRGGPPDAYWTAVAGELSRPITVEQIARLTEVDTAAWATLHPASVPLLRDLSAAGVPIALLSNAPLPLAVAVRAQLWAALLSAAVFSCDVRAVKPDPAIYAEVTTRTGVAPGRLVFFDDRPDNVAGAQQAGWMAYLWRSHDDARAVLSRMGVTM